MNLSGVIKFTEFYNASLPDNINKYITAYPTDVIILKLSLINAVLFTNASNNGSSQLEILKRCFSRLSYNRSERFMLLWKEKNTAFFTYAVIAQVMRDALMQYQVMPIEDIPFDEASFEDVLFDRILMQNNLYYSNDSDNLESYEGIWKLQLMQQHYLRSNSNLFMVAPVKNLLLYKFMQHKFGGAEYLKEFSAALGLSGYFAYYFIFANILQQVFEASKKGGVKHLLSLDESQEKLFSHYAFSQQDLIDGKFKGDIHMELVTHPFYYIEGRHPVILDYYFFNYIVDFALTYKLHQLSSLKKDPRFSTYPEFKAELGKRYYEDFVAKEILSSIFKPNNFTVFPNGDNSPLSDFTIVRNQRDVLMIELKSVDLHPATLEQLDVVEFKSFLQEQFCKKKGVNQIAQQITNFATTEKLDRIVKNPKQKKKLCIYPVIIYTDHAMDVNGVNGFLDEHFQKKIDSFQLGFRNIYPLTVIKLDLFIRYYSILRRDPKLLYTWIKDYHKLIKKRNKVYEKIPNAWTFFEKHLSFYSFIESRYAPIDFGDSFRQISKDLKLKDN